MCVAWCVMRARLTFLRRTWATTSTGGYPWPSAMRRWQRPATTGAPAIEDELSERLCDRQCRLLGWIRRRDRGWWGRKAELADDSKAFCVGSIAVFKPSTSINSSNDESVARRFRRCCRAFGKLLMSNTSLRTRFAMRAKCVCACG